jgi:hypothetical protein
MAHGADRGADPLEGHRLPGRKGVDGLVSQERPKVVGQALGLGRRRHRYNERVAASQAGQAGDSERLGRLGNSDDIRRPTGEAR